MRRLALVALSAVVAMLVPVLLVVNGVRVIANDWYVRFEYGREGFPPDPYGLTRAERTELALMGLRSILPQSEEGIELLRRAWLPDGKAAFTTRELRHMHDVRSWLGRIYLLHWAALAALAVLAAALALSPRTRAIVPRALGRGALLTVALAVGAGLAVIASYDAFSAAFHGLFFEGDSWRFAESDTLRRLYPDRFWSDTAILLGAGAIAQALVLLVATRFWLRTGKAIAARGRTRHA